MLYANRTFRSYQRGGWKPGSKHQKHMGMNPTLYLYRFPGPSGPGPYTMKYWWTLGCFPTGREVPFRLQEFLCTYQKEHVPIEVEEWLSCFVKDPVEELVSACKELLDAIEAFPETEKTRGYKAIEPSIVPLLSPLKKMEKNLGLHLPPIGVRAVLNDLPLKERFLDELYDYQEEVRRSGSTPHRRLARRSFEEPQIGLNDALLTEKGPHDLVSTKLGELVGSVVSPPETTASDEKKLIHLLTTVSEGCAKRRRYDDASSVITSSLMFAHDTESQAVVHANLAVSSLLDGKFKDAEFNGREAALLQPKAETVSSPGIRGYAVWAAAVAYQDDFEKAESILHDAVSMYEENTELRELALQLRTLRTSTKNGEIPQSLRCSKSHLSSQRSRALLHGSGKSFDNEFDWVVFKNKLYPSKMNPTSNEMGSVFRRVGDLGGFKSTSRSMERL